MSENLAGGRREKQKGIGIRKVRHQNSRDRPEYMGSRKKLEI